MNGHPISENLVRILGLKDPNLNSDVDLGSLNHKLSEVFRLPPGLTALIFQHSKGIMRKSTLGTHLLNIVSVDSVVRDIQTTGHLAKFISRLDVFQRNSSYEIIGMPNVLFDRFSQEERSNYFEAGGLLYIDGSLLDKSEVKVMMKREAEFLKHSS